VVVVSYSVVVVCYPVVVAAARYPVVVEVDHSVVAAR
jgi:hypothetical protein